MKTDTLKPITIYVTPDDHAALKHAAADHGVTLSFFVAQLVRQYSPVMLSPVGKQGAPTGNQNRRSKRPSSAGD